MWRDGFALGVVSMVAGKDPDGSELRGASENKSGVDDRARVLIR